MNVVDAPRWETLAESVQGVNKQRNQDACVVDGTGTLEEPLVLAVADGHGSAKHARSDIGAQRATDLFAAHAREFAALARAEGSAGPPSLSRLMHYARHVMPRRLVAAWQREMLGHYDRNPPRPAPGSVPPAPGSTPGSGQLPGSGSRPGPSDEQRLLLYGTTLIGAVLTPRLFAAWQLGDGELAVIECDGRPALPLAPLEADLGDETESLCGRDAWRLMRVHWAPIVDPARTPRLITLSTDGLSKSYASDEGFSRFVTGLDSRLDDEGTESVRAALPTWLAKAARHSGDDTTLAAGRRLPPGPAPAPSRPGPDRHDPHDPNDQHHGNDTHDTQHTHDRDNGERR
ncbi:protein phosphatase 2C domain-containing protein [Streptomyces sp. NPDC091212]|uniref:protein phosphatase 2C domain-containing protein n=1 Tax=Streptomyces sp. NPDC091212 TaxID=3155191 RepID=UPI00342FA10F